jgi:uncharacterized protein (TIGR02597 family)
VTTTAEDASDTFIGAVLDEQVALVAAASGVTGAEVSVANTLVEDAYNSTHYALFTTGTQSGQWYQIADTTVSSVVLATDVGALGAATADEFKIIKFWTLSTILPATSEFATLAFSSNPFLPESTLLLNNLGASGVNLSSGASYFYHDGSSPIVSNVAGWYKVGTLAASDGVAVTPETYFTIRNVSGGDVDVVVSGSVPVDTVGTTVVSAVAAQDNQLVNPYPSALTLDNSGLTDVVDSSANPFLPGDQLLLFDNTGSGINRSSIASYFYQDGSSPIVGGVAGWYQVGTLAASGAVEIPAGGAFWIRKAANPTPEVAKWEPVAPYSL